MGLIIIIFINGAGRGVSAGCPAGNEDESPNPGGRGTLDNGRRRGNSVELSTFFMPQVYERVGISIVLVYKKSREICHWVYERAPKG